MSRKRSASSSTRPEEIDFFVDRSLGSELVPNALRAAGAWVERHCDHFADSAPDVAWLTAAGARQWVVLTRDVAIRRNEVERSALLSSGVRAFVFTRGDLDGRETAAILAAYVPSMTRWARTRPAPFLATINSRGLQIVRF